MKLHQLRFAVAVGRSNSFTQAAESCNVTQPTLSNSIAQLELELGAELFERTTRRVAPTEFGKAMLPLFENVLAGIRKIEETASAVCNGGATIRIGLSPVVDLSRLSAILAPFRKANPGVEVRFTQSFIKDLERGLNERDLDLIIWPAATEDEPRRPHTLVYSEELMFLPPLGASRQAEASVTLADISGELIVPVADLCGLWRVTRKMFAAANHPIKRYPGEAISYEAVQQCVEIGAGAAVLPKSKVADAFQAEAKAIHSDGGDSLKMDVVAVWAEKAESTREVALLRTYLSARLGKAFNSAVRRAASVVS